MLRQGLAPVLHFEDLHVVRLLRTEKLRCGLIPLVPHPLSLVGGQLNHLLSGRREHQVATDFHVLLRGKREYHVLFQEHLFEAFLALRHDQEPLLRILYESRLYLQVDWVTVALLLHDLLSPCVCKVLGEVDLALVVQSQIERRWLAIAVEQHLYWSEGLQLDGLLHADVDLVHQVTRGEN